MGISQGAEYRGESSPCFIRADATPAHTETLLTFGCQIPFDRYLGFILLRPVWERVDPNAAGLSVSRSDTSPCQRRDKNPRSPPRKTCPPPGRRFYAYLCRRRRLPFLLPLLHAVAWPLDANDLRMMQQAIKESAGKHLIAQQRPPLRKAGIARQDDGSFFVARGD